MTSYLKQSTATTIKFGPFVDATDADTAEDGLTIQKADVRLSKNGGDFGDASADQGEADAGAPYDEGGFYDVSLDATDTNTLGRLQVQFIETATCLPVFHDFTVLSAVAYARQVEGAEFVNGGRVWFINAASGNDANLGTRNNPVQTYGAAETAATAGDTIHFLDTYASKVTVTKSGLTLTGSGSIAVSGSDATNNGAIYVAGGVNYTTVRDLTISGTHADHGTAVRFGAVGTFSIGNRLLRCKLTGKFDGSFMTYQRGLVISGCNVEATFDGGYFSFCTGLVENTRFFTDGTYAATGGIGHRAVVAGLDNTITYRNCRMTAIRAVADDDDLVGFGTTEPAFGTTNDSHYTLDGCTLYAAATHASDTGRVMGIGAQSVAGTRYAFRVTMNGGRITTSSSGTPAGGSPWNVDAPTGSVVTLIGPVATDRTKFNAVGTARIEWLDRDPLRPSTADRTLGVESDGDLTKVNTLDGHTAQTSDHTASIAAIYADTNELQTDWADGGRLDQNLDDTQSYASQASTEASSISSLLGTPIAGDLATDIAAIPTAAENVAALLSEGDNLLSSQNIDGVSLDTIIAAMLATAAGKVVIADNGDGTYTATFKKQDGTTNALVVTYDPATGARATTASIP